MGLRRNTAISLCALGFCLASCQTAPRHQFPAPSADWQVRTGQLAYTDAKLSLIGEVLVRSSKNGDFELTFTKAGGVTLLTLRQDAQFGQIEGPLARGRWTGRIAEAPPRFRGWFQLRDKIVNAHRMTTVRHEAGAQSFTLRF